MSAARSISPAEATERSTDWISRTTSRADALLVRVPVLVSRHARGPATSGSRPSGRWPRLPRPAPRRPARPAPARTGAAGRPPGSRSSPAARSSAATASARTARAPPASRAWLSPRSAISRRKRSPSGSPYQPRCSSRASCARVPPSCPGAAITAPVCVRESRTPSYGPVIPARLPRPNRVRCLPHGALAQLVERCLCKADVRSSNLLGSTAGQRPSRLPREGPLIFESSMDPTHPRPFRHLVGRAVRVFRVLLGACAGAGSGPRGEGGARTWRGQGREGTIAG